jgi:dodecin
VGDEDGIPHGRSVLPGRRHPLHDHHRRPAMAVARVTTIIGSSPKGWQDAVSEALTRANKTLRNLTGIRVLEQTAHVERGKVTEYRSKIEVTFILED